MITEKKIPIDQVILDMSKLIDVRREKIKDLTEQMNALKEEVRGLMIENEMKYAANELIEVKMSIPHSLDLGMLKYAHPELAAKFIKEKVVTKVSDEISKADRKLLQEKYPKVWKEINPEGTPRLTIKRLD